MDVSEILLVAEEFERLNKEIEALKAQLALKDLLIKALNEKIKKLGGGS